MFELHTPLLRASLIPASKILYKMGAALAFAVAANFGGAGAAHAAIIAEYTLGEDGLAGPPIDLTGHHDFINPNGDATVDTSTFAPVGGSTASLAFTRSEGYYFVYNTDGSYPLGSDFSVDIWAKASSTGIADARLLSSDGVGTALVGSLQIGVSSGNYTADVNNGAPGAGAGLIFATGPAITTAWTELTLVNQGGTTTFYVNGVAYGSTTATVDVGEDMHLGVAPGGSSFSGNLDQLTVSTVPEPSSVILCGLGAVGLLIAARRRRQA